MKKFFSAIILSVFLSNANAVIIDSGGYITDTDTNLHWADLTATNSLTYNQASTVFSTYDGGGWRYATNSEIETLFATLFDGYYTNSADLLSYSIYGSYADQTADIAYFQSLFGLTANSANYTQSFGLYLDEDNILRLMGVYVNTVTGDDIVVGTEYTGSYNPDQDIPNFGAFIVRDIASVPEPSTLALFGLGLLGLGFAKKRRA